MSEQKKEVKVLESESFEMGPSIKVIWDKVQNDEGKIFQRQYFKSDFYEFFRLESQDWREMFSEEIMENRKSVSERLPFPDIMAMENLRSGEMKVSVSTVSIGSVSSEEAFLFGNIYKIASEIAHVLEDLVKNPIEWKEF